MSVKDSQCALYVTEFGSHSVNIALSVVQGIVTFSSVIGSLLLILSYIAFKPLRTKSRLLITHLAAANLLQALANFLPVFVSFRTMFIYETTSSTTDHNSEYFINITNITGGLGCSEDKLFDHATHLYCSLCVYLHFLGLVGLLATIFWTVCLCIHYFIMVFYRNTKLASRVAYLYYGIAWLAPLGSCLWLLFHNWLGFEPTYSTVNCGIRTSCVPDHRPYHYQRSYDAENWNRIIGVLFGLKIWQALAFFIIPCLFVVLQCRNRKRRVEYSLFTAISSSTVIKSVERKILLIPIIFMLLSSASFVSDLYFYINHNKNLDHLQGSDAGIIFVHFLIRIFDNSSGVINFCLFCLLTKEVRNATMSALQRVCHPRSTNKGITPAAHEFSWRTSDSTTNISTPEQDARYYLQESDSLMLSIQ